MLKRKSSNFPSSIENKETHMCVNHRERLMSGCDLRRDHRSKVLSLDTGEGLIRSGCRVD